jgi:hypothetical protein
MHKTHLSGADKTEALLGHLRKMAEWLQVEARNYEDGATRHLIANIDDSADRAASLRHKAGNILAVIESYKRLKSRES